MTDHHPYDPNAAPEEPPPHSLEAEQALLGVLLFDNNAFVQVDGHVVEGDFHEPFHARLFKAIAQDVRHGRLIDPVLASSYFAIDPAFDEFGGMRYLLDLVDRAPPGFAVEQYAKQIRSLSLRRRVMAICRRTIERAREEAAPDGQDLMAELEREMLDARKGKDDLGFTTWGEASRAVVYGMDRPDERPLVRLGLDRIDNILGGAERGDMIVLGGRPGMGKSALAGCIALNVAMGGAGVPGLGVAEVNAEMTTHQMSRRHITDLAFTRHGPDAPFYKNIRRGDLTDKQREIVARVQSEFDHLPLVMTKRTGLTLGRLRAMLQRQRMLWDAAGVDLAVVVIDHAGLIEPDVPTRSRNEAQTIVSGGLKVLAEDLNVVMIALAQLNREVEKRDDKRPQLADLRDSGAWEQDADVVIGVYREAYYANREKEPKGDLERAQWFLRCGSKKIEALALKVREGDVGSAELWGSIGHNAIRDEAPDDASFLI